MAPSIGTSHDGASELSLVLHNPAGSALVPSTASTTPALPLSLVHSRLLSSPTLLPATIAQLITGLSLAARISVRASAFFIEIILESSKCGTAATLQLTRSALISAVASARVLHGKEDDTTGDGFLSVLDKYTNLGIYVIHHTFTLVELFAMSSFYLTINTVKTGRTAFEASVQMFDSMCGSNESSRALSSFITLVRSELTQDPNFYPAQLGAISSLTALTKALTAFVCVQTATHRRTLKEMRLRVVYDCTIVVDSSSSTSKTAGEETKNNSSAPIAGNSSSGGRKDPNSSEATEDAGNELEQKSKGIGAEGDTSEIEAELESLCGDDEVEGLATPAGQDRLPESVMKALREVEASREKKKGKRKSGYTYDIEVEEVTTTRTTTIQANRENDSTPNSPTRSSSEGFNSSLCSFDENGDLDEEDWVEVNKMLSDAKAAEYAENPGGGSPSVATLTRQETLQNREGSRARLQVVLQTMTQKFSTRRKTTVRQVDGSEEQEQSPSTSHVHVRDVFESEDSRATTPTGQGDPTKSTDSRRSRKPRVSGGVLRVFNRVLQKSPPDTRSSSSSQLTPTPSNASNSSLDSSPPSTPQSSHRHLAPDPSPSPSHRSSQLLTPPVTPTTKYHQPPASPEKRSKPQRHLRTTASSHSMQSTLTTVARAPSVPIEEVEPKASNFPARHLVENLQRFMRWSSACYGQTFLRLMGIGKHDFNFPHTQTHANDHAFALHVGIKVEDILLSSYTDPGVGFASGKLSPIINYVAVDHSISAVVLSCRGSLGLSDILVDLTCSYEPITIEHGDPHGSYYVHSGMYCSATVLQRGTVHEIIREALVKYPTYGLVLCGHSLGGGVAALLSILWSVPTQKSHLAGRSPTPSSARTPFVTSPNSGFPPGRPIHCYSYGPPCVASPDLVKYCRGLVTSTIHNFDIVPTLSLGLLKDLKNVAQGLYSEQGMAEEIVGRVIGLYQRRYMSGKWGNVDKNTTPSSSPLPGDSTPTRSLMDLAPESMQVVLSGAELEAGKSTNAVLKPEYKDPSLSVTEVTEDEELNDWLWSLAKTIRAGNDNEKLYPPGTVYLIENYTVFVDAEASSVGGKTKVSHKEGRRIIFRQVDNVETRFSEPIFGKSMLSDHFPLAYEQNLDLLSKAVLG